MTRIDYAKTMYRLARSRGRFEAAKQFVRAYFDLVMF
jgi:hypothetical protein